MLIFLSLAALAICGLSFNLIVAALRGDRQEPFADVDGASVQTLVELVGDRAYPKALTIGPDGFIYSGSACTGELWRISPEGELEVWLPSDSGIEALVSLAFAPDGTLYAIDSQSCDPRASVSKIQKIDPQTKIVSPWSPVAEDQILYALAFDGAGRLYASDTQNGLIYRYDEGGVASTWWELPDDPNSPQPRGLAYDPQNEALVVADSSNGFIYRVAIAEDGSPGDFTALYEDSQHNLEGIALDDEGRVIFVSYDEDDILRLENLGMSIRLAANFRDPANVAFADDRIYVTNFDGLSLSPLVSIIYEPSLPFTIDVIDLSQQAPASN
jgi:sugar lactone lactonase YvrE